MITRIAGAYSTLAANPRKKRHSAVRRTARRTPRKAASSSAQLELMPAAKKTRAPRKAASRRAPRKYKLKALRKGSELLGYGYPVKRQSKSGKTLRTVGYSVRAKPGRKKPAMTLYRTAKGRIGAIRNAGPVVAGVPVVAMAIGSAASIGLGQVASALISKVPGVEKLPTAIQPYLGDVAVAAAAAYLHGSKFLKNPMHKQIAQYAFIGSVFKIIDKATAEPIQNALSKIPALGVPAAAGIYFDPATAQTAGMYLSAEGQSGVGGMYVQAEGSDMGGLFSGQSIYG